MILPFFILFGLPVLVLAARLVLIYSKSIWCSTTGEIIDFKIKTRTYPSKFPSLQDDFIAKWLRAKYRFTIGNKTYESKRVSLDIMNRIYTDEDLANDPFLKSVRDKQVTVYYVKHFPRLSVLTMPFQKGQDHLAFIFRIILMSGFGLIVLWNAERNLPTKNVNVKIHRNANTPLEPSR